MLNYKGKRVLVTGADGFCGSYLVASLVDLEAEVFAFCRQNSNQQLKRIDHLKEKVQVIWGDVSDASDVLYWVKQTKPDIIFHLAAVAYVPYSFTNPAEVFRVNANGTLNLLESIREQSVERFVYISSSEVYGTALTEMIEEQHPLNPTSPYAASKCAADRLCYSYWITYKLPIVIVRPFNYFGPNMVYDVIPRFIKQAYDGKPLTIYGEGSQSRDFTCVYDIVQGLLMAGLNPDVVGEVINLGTGETHSVLDIAKLVKHCIRDILEKDVSFEFSKARLAEVKCLICDSAKAEKLLGWKSSTSLEQCIQDCIVWLTEREEK